MLHKHKLKFLPIFMIVALLASVVYLKPTQAAALTTVSDTMIDQTVSLSSNHTITFTTGTSGVTAGQAITLAFTSTSGTTFAIPAGFISTDMTMTDNATPVTLAASALTTTWGVAHTATTITITSATGTIAAGHVIVITLSSATHPITNPNTTSVLAQHRLAIAAGADSTTIALAIVDAGTVSITAAVDSVLIFDLDTVTTSGEFAAPYSVDLGTLTSSAVATSNGTSIKSIFADLSTNAATGAVVTVSSANGALKRSGGLQTIPSTPAASVAIGVEGYGLCVKSIAVAPVAGSTSGGPLTATSPFNTGVNCTYTAHNVGQLTTSAQPILGSTSLPIANGRAEILVKAAISPLTPAGSYSDTLTFTATATF